MQLTNTLTRKLEKFKPLKEEKVKVYFCGPTPYNFAHIGNLRTYLFEDLVISTLGFLGYKIETTMNITDIDDKTIRDSQKNNEDLKTFTQKYSKYFFEDLQKLNIKLADNIAPISELIPEMVTIINGLLAKGYAYLADDGSIYFSIAKFKKYGELAHLDKAGMKSSVRINNDEYEKEEVADFALWKAYDEKKDGPNKWEGKFEIISNENQSITPDANEAIKEISSRHSEFISESKIDAEINSAGRKTISNEKSRDYEKTVNNNLKTKDSKLITIWGRPGWHIECSACNMKYFGPQIDLHMGAVDNIFPHHQNEIAQTESYTGKQFSKYWMHAGHLLVDNKKMSKSANNFYTLRDIEEKLKGKYRLEDIYRGFRLMNFQAKYSDSFNFTFDKLSQAITTLSNFDELLKRIKNYSPNPGKTTKDVSNNMQFFIQQYIEKLENDFNSAEALVIVFDFIKYINSGISENLFNSGDIEAILGLLKTFNEVLKLFDFSILDKVEEAPEEITELLKERIEAKNNKDFTLADSIRDIILLKGYKVVDDKSGARVEKI